jgi:hypothetical protein
MHKFLNGQYVGVSFKFGLSQMVVKISLSVYLKL